MRSALKSPVSKLDYYQMVTEEEKQLTEFMEGQEIKLDWTRAKEDTRYYTHGLHLYPARMPPHISRRLLRIYSKSTDDLVLDPFCGSGGVLVESMLYGRDSVGIDLNPLACLIAKVKTTPLDQKQLEKVRSILLERIERESNRNRLHPIPKIRNVQFWFKKKAIEELSVIKSQLQELDADSDVLDFFKVCFSLTVRKSSNLKNGQFKLYGKQGKELADFVPEPIKQFSQITNDNINRMRSFTEGLVVRGPVPKAKVIKGDTAKLLELDPETLRDNSVKLVITSPPYGDSHTTVAYGQFSRYSSLWLGLPDEEVMNVDGTLLGGRIIPKETDLGSPTLVGILSEIEKVDKYRAKEVFAFFHDADLCLDQIARSLIKGQSHCIFVLANRTVRRVKVPCSQIFIELAGKYGLEHMHNLERDIPNKVVPMVNAPENIPGLLGSTMTKESIVIWKY